MTEFRPLLTEQVCIVNQQGVHPSGTTITATIREQVDRPKANSGLGSLTDTTHVMLGRTTDHGKSQGIQ